ncbi:phosphatidylinositol-4-phosphate 5-kinase [Strigomonas culicis]|uniref:Phosphatidylinositol-4-phosphate 5-kinase n=1 Tax=Strigomonas culicis TaxID=28005 RepID=S9UY61_9TRYP|nr:phosphatidylinositol-4-phosphate 5-kinase [Strigomonas culicis]|eukprot:EPY19521.1 phosphatidylinositol-4-phosphate 5-kinase [Strigomonas culicis]
MSNEIEIKTYTYKSGAIYEGTFDGSLRSGRGHWQHPQGEIYEGEYVNNLQEGLGIYLFPSTGKRYLGHWRGGQMHGEGVYYFNDACTVFYFGDYAKDKKDGEGFYMYATGVLTLQRWESGKLLSEEEASPLQVVNTFIRVKTLFEAVRLVAPRELGEVPPPSDVHTFQFTSGPTYTGQYFGTKKHGQGYWLHPEGDSYEGQFEFNVHCGWGVYIIGGSRKRYVGEWRDGKMNGIGVYFFDPAEKEYFVGVYQDDTKHGRGLYHFAESGESKVQLWNRGTLVQETVADAKLEAKYVEAVKKIIETVKPYAPNYESMFKSK